MTMSQVNFSERDAVHSMSSKNTAFLLLSKLIFLQNALQHLKMINMMLLLLWIVASA